jgi:type IV fimbrial biogenesis protein FimT
MKQQGFTLIELMIVVVITAITASIAIPVFGDFIKSNRMRASVGELMTAFQFARSEAVKRGATVNLNATNTSSSTSNEWGEGLTVWFDTNNDGNLDAGEEIRILPSFHSTLLLNGTNGIESIGFGPTGITNMTNTLEVEVCDDRTGETGRKISILTTGVVSINTNFICS